MSPRLGAPADFHSQYSSSLNFRLFEKQRINNRSQLSHGYQVPGTGYQVNLVQYDWTLKSISQLTVDVINTLLHDWIENLRASVSNNFTSRDAGGEQREKSD